MPGDIIILHMCTKNYGHIKYSSWDMVHNAGLVRNGKRSRAPQHAPKIILGALLSLTLDIKIVRLVFIFNLVLVFHVHPRPTPSPEKKVLL